MTKIFENPQAELYAALRYAILRHGDQKRGGAMKIPYIIHPIEVMELLGQSGFSQTVQVAALLHDVVEDTYPATFDGMMQGFNDIADRFGNRVRELVQNVTLPPEYRKDKHGKLMFQVEKVQVFDNDTRALKIADKISNVRSLLVNPPGWSRDTCLAYASDARVVVEEAEMASSDLRISSLSDVFQNHYSLTVRNI